MRFSCILFFLFPSLYAAHPLEITAKSCWKNIETTQKHSDVFGSKWILAGTVIIKKYSLTPICLDQIILTWHGIHLENLYACSYKHPKYPTFIALEENILCESAWHKHKQQLIFKFNEPLSLDVETHLYLVLTIPKAFEISIQQGQFELNPFCYFHQLNTLSPLPSLEPALLVFS